jgi:hypothetical protein
MPIIPDKPIWEHDKSPDRIVALARYPDTANHWAWYSVSYLNGQYKLSNGLTVHPMRYLEYDDFQSNFQLSSFGWLDNHYITNILNGDYNAL